MKPKKHLDEIPSGCFPFLGRFVRDQFVNALYPGHFA